MFIRKRVVSSSTISSPDTLIIFIYGQHQQPLDSQPCHQKSNFLTTAVVVNNTVGAAALEISTLTSSRQGNNSASDGRRAGKTRLETLEVKSKTNDVRASHGSTGDGVGGSGRADPSRKDVETRSEDIDSAAEVGEVGTGIVAADSADGDGRRGGGGGSAGGVNGFDKGAGLRLSLIHI